MKKTPVKAYDYSNSFNLAAMPIQRSDSFASEGSDHSTFSKTSRMSKQRSRFHAHEKGGNSSVAGSVCSSMLNNAGAIKDINCRPIARHTEESWEEGLSKVESLLNQPIQCGFLLAFCQAQHCAENVSFAIEIDRCKDYFALDRRNWPRDRKWSDLDVQYGVLTEVYDPMVACELEDDIRRGYHIIPSNTWKSTTVPLDTIDTFLKLIWDNYLWHEADSQICISSATLVRTSRRMRLIHVYGEMAFYEALEEPLKTMKKDILPRFVASRYHSRLKMRLSSLHPLPSSSDLVIESPDNIERNEYSLNEIRNGTTMFTLRDCLHDKILYDEFFAYLSRSVATENLLCYRAIDTFERLFDQEYVNDELVDDWAWTVYRFFVAAGSCYEVSVSYRNRKDIMYSLVKPHDAMFSNLQESAIVALKEHFAAFQTTPEYANLTKYVSDYHEQLQKMRQQKQSSKSSCFSCAPESKYSS